MTTHLEPVPTILPDPPLIDVVPVADAEALLCDAQRPWSALHREVAESVARAEELERANDGTWFDPESSAYVLVRLRRFLDGLRGEANDEIASLIAAAEHKDRRRQIALSWEPVIAERKLAREQ